ncbi:MAG: hypothetical protein Q9157_002170 [Trypethelium eluteriae]
MPPTPVGPSRTIHLGTEGDPQASPALGPVTDMKKPPGLQSYPGDGPHVLEESP